jgi:hypothetical protein
LAFAKLKGVPQVAVSQRRNVRPLSRVWTREEALSSVAKLTRLLPGFALKSTHVDWKVDLGSVPVDFTSVSSVKKSMLRNSFLKKFKGFTFGNPRDAAKASFLKYEDRCRATNHRLRHERERITNPFLNTVLAVAQRKISI